MVVRRARRIRHGRTRELVNLIREIRRRRDKIGPDTVTLGRVKAHIGIKGNERADEEAKRGAADDPIRPTIREGGVKQVWKDKRGRERCVKGIGMTRATKWNESSGDLHPLPYRERSSRDMEARVGSMDRPSVQNM